MSIIDLSVRKPVAMTMLLMIVMMFGLYSCFQLPVDFLPDIENPILTVSTDYDGAGPEEIENSVTRPLEQYLSTVENIDNISSSSKEGNSTVQLEFKWGTDLDTAMFNVREKIDLARDSLPDDAKSPIIYKFSTDMIPVMGFYMGGIDDLATAYDIANNQIKKALEQVPGVGQVEVSGGILTEVHIELIQNRLQAYSLDAEKVRKIVAANDISASGGSVYQGSMKYGIRTDGELKTLLDIRNIVVEYRNGTPILLSDIAEVSYGGNDDNSIFYANGEPAVSFTVTKSSGANTVKVAEAILKRLESLKSSLPPSVQLTEMFNTAQNIIDSQKSVSSAAFSGAVFAMLVLFFYLWNWRALAVIGLSIPTSIITTFVVMFLMGTSLNIISMSGLALGVGMMVDSSIVVLENIFRHRSEGEGRYNASINGAKEVTLAITASTFTTIAVFLPIFLTPGFIAQLFRDLAITVVISLLSSLVISITLVPMLCSLLIKDSDLEDASFEDSQENEVLTQYQREHMRWNDRILHDIDVFYKHVLEWCVAHKKLIVYGSTAGVLITLTLSVVMVAKEYMPVNDDGRFEFTLTYPPGTRVNYNDSMTTEIVRRLPEVIGEENLESIGAQVKSSRGFFGSTDEFKSKVTVKLVPVADRSEGINDIVTRVRRLLEQYPVKNYIRVGGGMSGGSGGEPIELEVRGDDLEITQKLADQIITVMNGIDGIENPRLTDDEGLPEIVLKPNRIALAREGLSATDLFNTIRTAFGGRVATTILGNSGDDIDVLVKVRDEDRVSIDALLNLNIPTSGGKNVSFKNLVTSVIATGPAQIRRKDSTRYIQIKSSTSGIFEKDVTGAVDKIREEIGKNLFVPAGVQLVFTGDYEDTQESMLGLAGAFLIAIFIVYALMAAQFESYIAPFVIMASVPFGALGAILALFVSGRSLNVISAAGIVVLVGIVINNGIVLIDYMNQLLAKRTPVDEAAIQAGVRRIRPVFMTTLTTILGLIPMALGIGEGGDTYAPLATSILGGLIVSTLFTLLIVPTAYAGIRKRFPFVIREDNV